MNMKISRKALRSLLLEIFPKQALGTKVTKGHLEEASRPDEPALGDRPEYALETKDPERDEIASIYSDVYKEKYGIRPRHVDFDTYSADELQGMLDRLYDAPGDEYDDYNDNYAPEPEYPDMEGTVPAEETPASVRSGGFVRPLGSEEDEPDERVGKSWKGQRGEDFNSSGALGRVQSLLKKQR